MRHRRNALLAAVAAACMLASSAGSAVADQLEITNLTFRARWTPLTMEGGFGAPVTCDVVLEGTLHRGVIAKTPGLLAGHVTTASMTNCRGGTATVLTETLPWHLQYVGFTGTLPDIRSVNVGLVGVSVQVNNGIICLLRSTTSQPILSSMPLTAEREGTINKNRSVVVDSDATIALAGGNRICILGRGTVSGTALLTPIGSENPNILINLV